MAIFAPKNEDLNRPAPEERGYTSQAIEDLIERVSASIAGPRTRRLFRNCLPNTLDTTIRFRYEEGIPDTFVITGDIEAMWLRDSSAQVWPYLAIIEQDSGLSDVIAGVINRQIKCVLIDPYANAFNEGPIGSEWDTDLTTMKPELHERKWEIDSLCYVLRLGYGYWKTTGRTECFGIEWLDAMKTIVRTLREQQRKDSAGTYTFMRETPIASDTVPMRGWGNPTKPTGMVHSMLRPSDDACIYPYLIPSNLFAVVELGHLAEMLRALHSAEDLALESEALAAEISGAVQKYAIRKHPIYGDVYSYEVDGYENAVYMDDANVPSLLSLPYLGYCTAEDPVYQNTRRLILSLDNPYFYRGKAGEGIGGPHIGPGYIWPMSIIMRALTSGDDIEISTCLKSLAETDGGAGFLHESFHKDDPNDFTRPWFAWVNTLFGELILKVHSERPHLLAATV